GRFQSSTLSEVDEFNASVGFDYQLYPYDIAGSIAHARMLAQQGIIKKSDAEKIVRGLQKIYKNIQKGDFEWDLHKEDVHLNIEAKLTELIGEVGGKLHTARSRNDQVATDIRLYCRDQVSRLAQVLLEYQRALLEQAEKHIDTLLPGYTHLQRAQPISLAHHLMAYYEMALRDLARLVDSFSRINTLPLGSGALAGTTFPIDRNLVAKELGFSSLAHNSLDAVSDRDFVIETLANLSLLMMHLSRLAEEWILWTSQEFQFIQLPEAYCTGSSMMPQKINPDVLELIRGKTGRVYGALQTLLTLMKGLPLTYNKDMQEDKEGCIDTVETLSICLKLLISMLPKMKLNKARMYHAAGRAYSNATDLADYLAKKGLPFREAHEVVGQLVAKGIAQAKDLQELSLAEMQEVSSLIEQDVYEVLKLESVVNVRNSYGGTGTEQVKKQIKLARRLLET
ncbi:MAG: argininosuccinate lyase, partial [Trueperaceae bacterium]|nr:argininosuccinate lyase [Trueperaceae bacterium]